MTIDPRKLVSALRMMPDQQLHQVAQLHFKDPYIFPPVFQESQRRQTLRSGMQSDDKSGDNPLPVNQQALMAMAPQNEPTMGAQPMPEDVGLGALPMKSDPFAKMAEGGIVAFAGGGKSNAAPSFDAALDAEGVTDPAQRAFLKSLYAQESSSGGNTTTSNRGAVGGMQILPSTFKQVADPDMDIRNTFDNMRAGIRYGMQGYQAAKGDPVLGGAYYYGGPGGMRALEQGVARKDKANPNAPDTRQYGESVAKRMFNMLPIGAAQAAPAGGDYASQIPSGGSYGTPTPAARDDRSYFGKLADKAGIPEEYQRNINNTLSALGGYSMPTAWATKAANLASKGLEPTAEAVANAARLKQVAETPRLMAPAKAGLEGLDEASKATQAAAVAARQARGLEADVKAARGAQQSVDAATKTAQIARGTEDALQAKNAATALNAAKVTNASRGLTGMQAIDQALRGEESAGMEPAPPMAKENFRKLEREPSAPPPDITKKEAIDAAKSTMTKEEQKESGLSAEDWLTLGFALLSGKSPNAWENFGNAGAAMLTGKTARTKAGLEALKTKQEIKQSEALARKYGAESGILEAGSKAENMLRTKAATLAASELKNWMTANIGATPEEVDAQRQKLVSYYTSLLTQGDTMTAAAPMDLSKWGQPSKT